MACIGFPPQGVHWLWAKRAVRRRAPSVGASGVRYSGIRTRGTASPRAVRDRAFGGARIARRRADNPPRCADCADPRAPPHQSPRRRRFSDARYAARRSYDPGRVAATPPPSTPDVCGHDPPRAGSHSARSLAPSVTPASLWSGAMGIELHAQVGGRPRAAAGAGAGAGGRRVPRRVGARPPRARARAAADGVRRARRRQRAAAHRHDGAQQRPAAPRRAGARGRRAGRPLRRALRARARRRLHAGRVRPRRPALRPAPACAWRACASRCRCCAACSPARRSRFDGEHYTVREERLDPAPAARVPILVGGNGRRTQACAARHADALGLTGFSPRRDGTEIDASSITSAGLDAQVARLRELTADRAEAAAAPGARAVDRAHEPPRRRRWSASQRRSSCRWSGSPTRPTSSSARRTRSRRPCASTPSASGSPAGRSSSTSPARRPLEELAPLVERVAPPREPDPQALSSASDGRTEVQPRDRLRRPHRDPRPRSSCSSSSRASATGSGAPRSGSPATCGTTPPAGSATSSTRASARSPARRTWWPARRSTPSARTSACSTATSASTSR